MNRHNVLRVSKLDMIDYNIPSAVAQYPAPDRAKYPLNAPGGRRYAHDCQKVQRMRAKHVARAVKAERAQKAKLTKAYRQAAGWATKASGARITGDGAIDLHITFHPPDKRRRDLDGMLSSIKAGIDGIADGLGVNDHRFRLHIEIGDQVKGGSVVVVIPCWVTPALPHLPQPVQMRVLK